MAALSKAGTPSLATLNPDHSCQVGSGLVTGEAVAAGDVCYIASDGTVMRSIGTSANAAAKADGIALKAAEAGKAITIMRNVELYYGTGLTPGARYFVGAAAGGLDTAATTGGTGAVAFAVDATRIRFSGSTY